MHSIVLDPAAREEIPALARLMGHTFQAVEGGEVWLCAACTKPRNIAEDQPARGAKIVGAAAVVEEIVNGAKTVGFA